MDSTQKAVSNVLPYTFTSTGTWYASEFEINYDPNVGNLSGQEGLLRWNISSTNITNLSIYGTSYSTVQGILSQPKISTSSGFFGSIIKGILNYFVKSGLNTAKTALNTTFPALSSITGTLLSGTESLLTNGVNATFASGKTDNTISSINLKISSQYNFTGTASDNSTILNTTLYIPGSIIPNSPIGYVPFSNNPLGLFCLTQTPVANEHNNLWVWIYDPGVPDESGYNDPWDDYPYGYEQVDAYNLDLNSYKILFNPSVINTSSTGAQIENLKQEIIYSTNQQTADKKISYSSEFGKYFYGNNIYNAPNPPDRNTVYGPDIHDRLYNGNQIVADYNKTAFLRISFDVVPNNGSQKYTIIKSFKIKNNISEMGMTSYSMDWTPYQ